MLALKILRGVILVISSTYTLVLIIRLLWWTSVPQVAWLFFLAFWFTSLITLEIALLWRQRNLFPRLLVHLRYAPFFVFFISILVTTVFDRGMILYSKYELRQYVYSNISPEEKPAFKLYNDYRGWCGNGYPAREYELYNEVAAEGFDSSDADVRARALRASIEVYDWLNGVQGGAFPSVIKRAQHDASPLIQKIAAEFRAERCGDKDCF